MENLYAALCFIGKLVDDIYVVETVFLVSCNSQNIGYKENLLLFSFGMTLRYLAGKRYCAVMGRRDAVKEVVVRKVGLQ